MSLFAIAPPLTVLIGEWLHHIGGMNRGHSYEMGIGLSLLTALFTTIAWSLAIRDVPPSLFF